MDESAQQAEEVLTLLLDGEGQIIRAKHHWPGRGRPDGSHPLADLRVGHSFVEACQAAGEPHVTAVAQAGPQLQAVLEGRLGYYELEYACQTTHGWRWYRIQATALAGLAAGGLLSHVDITHRKERELADQKSRFQSLFDQLPVSLWAEDFSQVKKEIDSLRAAGVADFAAYFDARPERVRELAAKIQVTDVNQTTVDLYGARSKADFLGPLQVIAPHLFSTIRAELLAIAEGRTQLSQEVNTYTHRGVPKRLSFTWSVMPGHETTYDRVLITLLDITDRIRWNREQQAILTVSSALRRAVNQAQMVPVLLDQLMLLLNGQGAALVFYDAASGVATVDAVRGAKTLPGELQLAANCGLAGQVIASGQLLAATDVADDPVLPGPCLIGVPLITGEKQTIGALLVARTDPFTAEDRRVMLAVADMAANAIRRTTLMETLEERVEERTRKLAAANERLKELDRLKSKFVSDVSHELRTPVTNLGLYMALLDNASETKREQYVEVLRKEIAHLTQLIEDILAMAQIEQERDGTHFDLVDLNWIAEAVVNAQLFRAQTARLTLGFQPDQHVAPIYGSRSQLSQVVTNLVVNAINYTEQGGVAVSTYGQGEWVCLQVSDTGCGITAEDLPYIFDRFYRGIAASQSGKAGTGLGLGIVKEIVEFHGGQVELDTTPGRGTTFRVRLPVARPGWAATISATDDRS